MEIDRKYQGYVYFYLYEEEEKFVMIEGDLIEYLELLCIKMFFEYVNGKCIFLSFKFREQFIRLGFFSYGLCMIDGSCDFVFSLYGFVWLEMVKC